MRREATLEELLTLEKLHRELQKRFPLAILDGKYIWRDDLEHLNKEAKPCYLFNKGKYRGIRQLNKNSIDAYQLKKYGISIKGQVSDPFNYSIDWEIIITNMRGNLNSYWVNWKNRCERFLSISYFRLFFSLSMIEWGVLGILRLFYTFREQGMTSKLAAGEYALRVVPERWHKIIHESMRLRLDVRKSYYKSIFERKNNTLEFIDYIVEECNGMFIS